jgi:NAD(P)-dependent dehydrogenase (short-subunit alcohol dehydrogenase family)
MEVNLLGTYYLGVQVLQQMQRQGSGSIVNVSSGAQAGMASGAAYCASKAGVAGLTYAWALDAAPHGVRVNALSPVATSAMTQATDAYLREKGQLQGDRPFVDPAANAPAAAFLLSDLARGVNGQVLRVHGEQLQLMSHPAVMLPVMTREQWDVPAVAQALAQSFGGGLPPLGIGGIEAKFVPLAKAHQVPR